MKTKNQVLEQINYGKDSQYWGIWEYNTYNCLKTDIRYNKGDKLANLTELKLIGEFSEEELKLIQDVYNTGSGGLMRAFMSTDEIKMANKLTKSGYFDKGKVDAKNGTVAFWISAPHLFSF